MPAGRSFNEQVVVDIVYVHDLQGQAHVALSMVDDASHYHVLQRLPSRSAENVTEAMVKGWFRFFGPPETMLLDAEGAMKSLKFEELAAQSGCAIRFVPADAHWQLGRAERHGAVAQEIAEKLIVQHGVQSPEEIELVFTMATFAKNQLIRRAGVSPSQWVFGRSPRIPGSLLGDGNKVEDKQLISNSKKLQQTELMRLDAMKMLLEIDMSNRLRTAMLRKSRPHRGGFEIGQRLAYWRVRNTLDGEGPFAGYRQGVLIGIDPGMRGSLWIRNDRGRIVQVAREQARALEEEEAWLPGTPDFKLLRDAEQDLESKHAVGLDQRQAAIQDADGPPVLALPDAPMASLDSQGNPSTPSLTSPPVIVRPPQQEEPLEQADKPIQQETKRLKTDRSSAASSSQRPSSDHTMVDPASVGREHEGSDGQQADGLSSNRRIDQLGSIPESERASMPSNVHSETAEAAPQAFHVSAKAFCQLCGSVDKVLEANVARCGRCLNSSFVDDVEKVLNWFDEETEFDAKQKRFTSNAPRGEELPLTLDLHQVSQTQQWLTSEVLVVKSLDQIDNLRKTNDKKYPLMSYAAWYSDHETWLWEKIYNQNVEVDEKFFDDQVERPNPSLYVVFLQRSEQLCTDPQKARVHLAVYGDQSCEKQWLARHGRDIIRKTGWDGSPQEFQSLFTNGNLYLQASLYDEFSSDVLATSFTSWVSENTQMDSSEDEEDIPRTQRQALKRELPWRTIPEADVPAFVEAMCKEWEEWCKWASCKQVDSANVPKHLILPSRVCYRWKPVPSTGGFKAKARIVIQGFRDPHLPLLTRDAPVLSRNGFMVILQWSACFKTVLWNADAESAFLQGLPDDERPAKIYMKPPQDGIALQAVPVWRLSILYELIAPVYGAANAPRRWYGRFRSVVEKLNWRVHSLDPCLFLWIAKFQDEDGKQVEKVVALLGVHVDDILVTALPEWEKEAVDPLRTAFTWGGPWEKDNFVFTGRRITKREDGGYFLDQRHYVQDVTTTKSQKEMLQLKDHPDLMSEFRSGIGSLQWMSGTTRPDISADVSLLQKGREDLSTEDLNEINKVIRYVKATPDAGIRIMSIDPDDLILVAFGDSAFGNAPNNKSQGGLLITATTTSALTTSTTCSVLEWKSYRHQRVLRSTLAAEAASLDRAEDAANFLGSMLAETFDASYVAAGSGRSPIPVYPVTDARSLFDAIHRIATTFAERRVEIDIAGLRQNCRNLKWVPSEVMKADVLTKRSNQLRDAFRKWMMQPEISLQESKDASMGSSNESWRRQQQSAEELTSVKRENHDKH